MFGYLNVEKERLTQGEYGLWHTFLCGVCLSAKRLLNNSSRLTSDYDINFFNVLFHSYTEHRRRDLRQTSARRVRSKSARF